VTGVGRSPWLWSDAIRFDLARRSYRVLRASSELELALFAWAAGQDTSYHDHGGASGAGFVCSGLLVEDVLDTERGRVVRERTFSRCDYRLLADGTVQPIAADGARPELRLRAEQAARAPPARARGASGGGGWR
jgi:hypothetical protein